MGWETHDIGPGDMFAVLSGTDHNFTNTGNDALKLFTVYSPPEHPDGVVHATKADALAHPGELATNCEMPSFMRYYSK